MFAQSSTLNAYARLGMGWKLNKRGKCITVWLDHTLAYFCPKFKSCQNSLAKAHYIMLDSAGKGLLLTVVR